MRLMSSSLLFSSSSVGVNSTSKTQSMSLMGEERKGRKKAEAERRRTPK
jgi:hypothetical protein